MRNEGCDKDHKSRHVQRFTLLARFLSFGSVTQMDVFTLTRLTVYLCTFFQIYVNEARVHHSVCRE